MGCTSSQLPDKAQASQPTFKTVDTPPSDNEADDNTKDTSKSNQQLEKPRKPKMVESVDNTTQGLQRQKTLKGPSKIVGKTYEEEEPLLYHSQPIPGKFTIKTTKPMNNQKDLSLAYSPGVAVPCIEIAKDPAAAYKYTNKGNTVAVISNGTAVLGLGNLGALASKPVMEGKAVLFNKFAGVESIDLCLDAPDPDDFINAVKVLGPSFGGINLEDIKAPDCFYVEKKLKEIMDIPVFHDD